jgi:hypothetical protein
MESAGSSIHGAFDTEGLKFIGSKSSKESGGREKFSNGSSGGKGAKRLGEGGRSLKGGRGQNKESGFCNAWFAGWPAADVA